MTLVRCKVHDSSQDGKAFLDGGSGWKWFGSNTGEAFTVGQWIIFRFPCDVPRGATVQLATFSVEYTQKNAATVPQTANFNVYVEPSAPAYPLADDTYFTAGTSALTTYRTTISLGAASINYTVNTPGADLFTTNLTSTMTTLISRVGYKPGAYFSMMLYCTAEGASSDMSFDMGTAFVDVTYTVPDAEKRRAEVNTTYNQGAETDGVSFDTGTFFGEFVDGSTVARTTGTKRSGAGGFQLDVGPPSGSKGASFALARDARVGEFWTFSGWVYVPSAITTLVEAGFWFTGGYTTITARNQWVEFCSQVVEGANATLRPHIRVAGPVVATWVLYVDDLCLMRTKVRQPPFTGDTADGFNEDHSYTQTQGRGQSVKESRARSFVHTGGSMKPRVGYVRRADGLWLRAD